METRHLVVKISTTLYLHLAVIRNTVIKKMKKRRKIYRRKKRWCWFWDGVVQSTHTCHLGILPEGFFWAECQSFYELGRAPARRRVAGISGQLSQTCLYNSSFWSLTYKQQQRAVQYTVHRSTRNRLEMKLLGCSLPIQAGKFPFIFHAHLSECDGPRRRSRV